MTPLDFILAAVGWITALFIDEKAENQERNARRRDTCRRGHIRTPRDFYKVVQ